MCLNFNQSIDNLNSLGNTVTNKMLKTGFEMLFLMKKRVKKQKKKMLFITELNFFFASILGCQLKKHLFNPLQNGITVWR